jgi:histidyl-tRNA synthetase
MNPSGGGVFIERIRLCLEAWGYRYLEVPVLMRASLFESCTQGTENRMFRLPDDMTLLPEVTNFVRAMGRRKIGADRVYYVTRCFRDESTTDAERRLGHRPRTA